MKRKYSGLIPAGKKNIFVLLFAALVYFISSSFNTNNCTNSPASGLLSNGVDSLLSKKAFVEVYKVLTNPRCMNCHPSGDSPLVGDDSHPHPLRVKRGDDGRGVYATTCTNCHKDKNTPGLNKPPGCPDWHMPPANMKMIFQGKTPRELAAQLLDTSENGHKTAADLINFIETNQYVQAAWNMGEGRNPPPSSHEEFAEQFKLWIDNGALLPDN